MLLPGKVHEQRGLAGYSPWAHKESDTTETAGGLNTVVCKLKVGLPRWLSGKESACQSRKCRRRGFDPWSGSSPGAGHGNPLQYPCLENLTDRGVWRATVHGVPKRGTRLSNQAVEQERANRENRKHHRMKASILRRKAHVQISLRQEETWLNRKTGESKAGT